MSKGCCHKHFIDFICVIKEVVLLIKQSTESQFDVNQICLHKHSNNFPALLFRRSRGDMHYLNEYFLLLFNLVLFQLSVNKVVLYNNIFFKKSEKKVLKKKS